MKQFVNQEKSDSDRESRQNVSIGLKEFQNDELIMFGVALNDNQ